MNKEFSDHMTETIVMTIVMEDSFEATQDLDWTGNLADLTIHHHSGKVQNAQDHVEIESIWQKENDKSS